MIAAATPRPRMTLEEWAELPEDEPGELVDGELVEEEMPSFVHTKRRVRSEPGTIGERWFIVGCGYATHDYASKELGRGIRLLHLSDGVSWRFSRFDAPDGGMPWVFVRPLAVTCEEVFLSVQRNGQFNVARIRIDSLGPGEPAD